MKKNKNKNIDGLLEHSSTKNKETIDKVNQAIDKLKRSKTRKINFQTVAQRQVYPKQPYTIMMSLRNAL